MERKPDWLPGFPVQIYCNREVKYMAIQTVQPYGDQIQMTIDGHHVTVSFTQEENPTLSALVRNTLLDAYIRKNDLSGEEQFA